MWRWHGFCFIQIFYLIDCNISQLLTYHSAFELVYTVPWVDSFVPAPTLCLDYPRTDFNRLLSIIYAYADVFDCFLYAWPSARRLNDLTADYPAVKEPCADSKVLRILNIDAVGAVVDLTVREMSGRGGPRQCRGSVYGNSSISVISRTVCTVVSARASVLDRSPMDEGTHKL